MASDPAVILPNPAEIPLLTCEPLGVSLEWWVPFVWVAILTIVLAHWRRGDRRKGAADGE